MIRMLDLLDDMLTEMGIVHARLDGTMDNELRPAMIADFNREGSALNVFLISTRAGGVGINLQSADTVILAESDWNPQADLQAVSRVQRIGQKRTVHVMRLVTHRQIDEVIIQRAREKKRIEAVAVGAGKFSTGTEGLRDMHQRDIAKLLDDLDNVAPTFSETEDLNANEVADEVADEGPRKSVESATTVPSVANSVLPALDKAAGPPTDIEAPTSVDNAKDLRPCEEMMGYAAEWDKLLLRTGETSLPPLQSHPVWPLASPAVVPPWLKVSGASANFIHAGLKASGPLDAARAVQAAKEDAEFLAGHSKRDRASRKSRFSLAELDESDVDSRSESSKSGVEFTPRKQRRRKRKLARVNLVSSDDDVYMPSDSIVVHDDDEEEDSDMEEKKDCEMEKGEDGDKEKEVSGDMGRLEEVVVGQKIAERLSRNRTDFGGIDQSMPGPALHLLPEVVPEPALTALRAPLARPQPLPEPAQANSLRLALQRVAGSVAGAPAGEVCPAIPAKSALHSNFPLGNAVDTEIPKANHPEPTSVTRVGTVGRTAVPLNKQRPLSDPVQAHTLRHALQGLAAATTAAAPEERSLTLPTAVALDARLPQEDGGAPAKLTQANSEPTSESLGRIDSANKTGVGHALRGPAASEATAVREEGNMPVPAESALDAQPLQAHATPASVPQVNSQPTQSISQVTSANKTAVLDLTVSSQAASQPIYLANAIATPETALVARPEGSRYLTDTMELELAFRKELRNRRLRKSLPTSSARTVGPRNSRSRGLGTVPERMESPPQSVKRPRLS